MERFAESMSLRDAFESIEPKRQGGRCYTCEALRSMSEDDASTLRELMESEVPSTVIAQACKRAGYRLSERTIGRHRKGLCSALP